MGSVSSKKMQKVVIVGAGPAGSSLAIRLAMKDFDVVLIERETFPRQKLCGEFISPECFRHFDEIGVKPTMFALGGDRIEETRFYSPTGRSVGVPTSWFGSGEFALSLSRSAMDLELLNKARSAGVTVHEGARAVGVMLDGNRIDSVAVKTPDGDKDAVAGDLFVDASGRSGVLSDLIEKQRPDGPEYKKRKPELVAFKNHFRGVRSKPGVCEIYFFEGGYGGLSHIENGLANFCFIVKANIAKEFIGKSNRGVEFACVGNTRARETLANASALGEWLAVPIAEFGRKRSVETENLISVGDAQAFIDPFTGSGMLMALESAELAANLLVNGGPETAVFRDRYGEDHRKTFGRRLWSSSILRLAAFNPRYAAFAIFAAGLSARVRELAARATRRGSQAAVDGR